MGTTGRTVRTPTNNPCRAAELRQFKLAYKQTEDVRRKFEDDLREQIKLEAQKALDRLRDAGYPCMQALPLDTQGDQNVDYWDVTETFDNRVCLTRDGQLKARTFRGNDQVLSELHELPSSNDFWASRVESLTRLLGGLRALGT